MGLLFEWDRRKARRNLAFHGVSFQEASTAFRDVPSVTVSDPLHSREEERFLLIGLSDRGRLLVVAHTERSGRIRIISARRATKIERSHYEEET